MPPTKKKTKKNGLGNLDWIFELSLTTETGTSRHSTRVLDKEPTGRTLQKTMLNRSKTMRKLPYTLAPPLALVSKTISSAVTMMSWPMAAMGLKGEKACGRDG